MTESLLLFIEQNSQWAALIVFIVALLESVAILGLLIPGWVLLVGIGTLIGADILSLYPILIAAYLGAVIGEYMSFLLGYHYHEKILTWRFVAKHQEIIQTCRQFFDKHGISGVFLGRFFGPTRAVVPLIAGISEMKRRTFFWVNIISGLLWAPLYLIPGILIGAAFSLEKEVGYHLIFICILIAIMVSVAINLTRKYLKAQKESLSTHLDLLKVSLAWSLAVTMLVIFSFSPYWNLLIQILGILWNKF
ncbi:DedA family protein [Aliikangiella sp. IMCC44359]|uniref:DedA family protein n=1 Tax=Aliikangiella sp. IMCC44359 TaxID=3459125 RepID=UPI00403A8FC9